MSEQTNLADRSMCDINKTRPLLFLEEGACQRVAKRRKENCKMLIRKTQDQFTIHGFFPDAFYRATKRNRVTESLMSVVRVMDSRNAHSNMNHSRTGCLWSERRLKVAVKISCGRCWSTWVPEYMRWKKIKAVLSKES